jgi:hypothetical protein
MVPYNPSRRDKVEGLGIVNLTHSIHKGRPEKLHYFQYRDEHIRTLLNRERNKDDKAFIKEEMKLMSKIGMAKTVRGHEMSNSSLMRMTIPEAMNTSLLWKAQEKEKRTKIKLEKDNFKRDEDYVKTLDNWERRTLSTLPRLK